tara:strand:- start:325 stop:552 length:228 start_codon:yes stop_codon:yes gene_type:complete
MANYRKKYIAVGKMYASDGVYYWECLSEKPTTKLRAEGDLYKRLWGDEYVELEVREVDKNSDYKLFDMVGANCDD